MSASFMSVYVAHRQHAKIDIEGAQNWVRSLSVEYVQEKLNGEYIEYDFEDFLDDDNTILLEGIKEAKERLCTWIAELWAAMTDDPDINLYNICGWSIYFHGCMSFGDTSETFDLLTKVDTWGDLGMELYLKAGFGFPPSDPEPFLIQEVSL